MKMKKIKKQPPVRPETPVSQVRYVLWYERYSSYCITDGKRLKQPPVTPEMSVTPVLRVRSVLWYERYSFYCRTNEKMKNSHPHVQQVQPAGQAPRAPDTIIRSMPISQPL